MLESAGRFIARRAWCVIGAWLLVFLSAGAYGADAIDHLSNEGGYNKSSDSWTGYQLYRESFAGHAPDFQVLYSSDSMTVDDPAFTRAVQESLADLPKDKVTKVVIGTQAPPEAGLVSKDRHAVMVNVSVRQAELAQMVNDYRSYEDSLVTDHPQVRSDVIGLLPVGDDMLARTDHDSKRAEIVALPIVLVLSLLIFGGLVAALMPPVIGLTAVTVALASMKGVAQYTPVSSQAMMIVTLLGMGLAIDYCLFIVSRFREELGHARGREATVTAMGPTLAHAGRTVLVSALIVTVSMAALLIMPLDTVRGMAYGAIPSVLTAMLASVTLLPALLAVLGHRVNRLRLPFARRTQRIGAELDQHGFWAGVARRVMRRPWTYLLAVTAILLALGSPALGAHWGSVDESQLPVDSPARQATARMEQYFGERQVLGYTIYAGPEEQIPAYVQALKDKGLQTVVPAGQAMTRQGQASFIYYYWSGANQSRESHQMVQDLRTIEVPEGSHAYVAGETAASVDQVDVIGQKLPLLLAAIAAAMLLLMGLAFRSLVIPVKAVVVSAISISASFGVITWIFQDGHLSRLLGFEAPGYLEVSAPLVMAAILFGLSMDYEVFLLSRVQEEYRRTQDNTASVAHGLARTGRIITGAALLLAVVIGGFVTSSLVIMKMVGLGMLVAVLLDATVVRGVLVPATMKLLGRWNWWYPGRRGRQATSPAAAQPVAASASPAVSEPSE